MADVLQEFTQYDAHVKALTTQDPVSGGHGAPINLQASQIANRTLYLRHQLDQVANYLRHTIGLEKDVAKTINDELIYLATTKEFLKVALQSKNLPLTDNTTFRMYAAALRSLLTGVAVIHETHAEITAYAGVALKLQGNIKILRED